MNHLLRSVKVGVRNLRHTTWLKEKDVWMPSFPRAGSTWVRYILSNIIALEEKNGKEIDFNDVKRWMPAFGSEFFTKNNLFSSVPRMIKTHRRYIPLLFDQPARCVYLIRDPRSIMTSYYRFIQKRTRRHFDGSFSEFIRNRRYGLPAFLGHYKSWIGRTNILLRYEDLKADTTVTMLNLFERLDWPISESVVAEAVARSTLSIMKETERKKGLPNPGMYKEGFTAVNTGKEKSWVKSFPEEDLAYYQMICDERDFSLYMTE